jgi:hypothetical protein
MCCVLAHAFAVEPRAVNVERRPIYHSIAGTTVPAGVSPAAVAEASDVTDEDLVRAERMSVGASRRRVGDPLSGPGLYQLA